MDIIDFWSYVCLCVLSVTFFIQQASKKFPSFPKINPTVVNTFAVAALLLLFVLGLISAISIDIPFFGCLVLAMLVTLIFAAIAAFVGAVLTFLIALFTQW